jgi:hypothetical protein
MDMVRRWFLIGGAVLAIIIGCSFGIVFMMKTIDVFNDAINMGGNDAVHLVVNLAHGIKGILAWIVFGITMTNALVIASSLSIVLMLSPQKK